MKRMIIILLLSLLATPDVSPLIDVSSSQGMTYTCDTMPDEIQAEIYNFDEDILAHLKDGDYDYIKKSYDERLEATVDEISAAYAIYSEKINNSTGHRYLGQYYFILSAEGTSSRAMAVSDDNTYIVSTAAETGEIFLSLVILEMPDESEVLISIEYYRSKDTWKIRNTYLNDYSYYNMNAIEFFNNAKSLEENGHIVSALIYMYSSLNIVEPSLFMQYNQESEIYEYVNSLKRRVEQEYTFPLTFEELEGVIVFDIDVKIVQGGPMPDIMYVTNLSLTDSSEENQQRLSEEAYKLHDLMSNKFPGLMQDFNLILYGAEEEIPTDYNAQRQRYGTVIHLNDN